MGNLTARQDHRKLKVIIIENLNRKTIQGITLKENSEKPSQC